MKTEYEIYTRTTNGYFGRRKEMKELRTKLRKKEFKRSFFKHPATETYINKDIRVQIEMSCEKDSGYPEHSIPPHDYRKISVKFNKEYEEVEELGLDNLLGE